MPVPEPLPVSVVVPCRDPRWLGRVVEALNTARRVPAEILIVDDGCAEPLAGPPGTRTVRTNGVGRGLARNRGAAQTSQPYLWFVDADVVVGPGTLVSLFEALVGDRIDAVMGVYIDRELRGYEGFRLTHQRYHVGRDPEPRHVSAACLLIRRSCFDAIGGFADLPALEDVAFGVLGWRRGYRWRSIPSAPVDHLPRGSFGRVVRRDHIERGLAAARLASQHGIVLDHAGSPRELAGFAGSLACVVAALTARRDRRLAAVGLAAGAVWAWADGPWLRYAWRNRGARFATASVGWLLVFRSVVAAGAIRGYLEGGR